MATKKGQAIFFPHKIFFLLFFVVGWMEWRKIGIQDFR